MTSVGLVLGAGGVVGQAYHAGALAALERVHGWDPRSASIIVGSSAGSVTATLLRLEVPASDLAAPAFGWPVSADGDRLMHAVMPDTSAALPQPTTRDLMRPWRAPSPALIARTVRRPWAFRPEVAAMTLLPRGSVEITDRAARLHAHVGTRWPEHLWICVARRADGARVVLGRPGSPRATLASAVLASCAIPAYFAPVSINGVEYFDGGVHSPTNADVLRSTDLDVVVVVSPMTAAPGQLRGAEAMLRWAPQRRLDHEVNRLESSGTKVVRIEPGPIARSAMGLRAMAEDRSDRVIGAAYSEVSSMDLPIPRASNPAVYCHS
ncbi:MAG: patatin-like phospholipase family protein [Acidimicrobiales bacterium]